ncbi:MAG: ROK family transcriptional regulator [Fusobacterium varium]|uniref:ROK family transcriptional regulator n=1 Tax=Fusobacterium varium TaxID=856 RepID=UPI00242E4447|nr:ROK family transcriptional regulator [Fusobacterium varium]UYI77349.1 MAG: ROK family transcriptional regulator [Fusobacterium varium]
MKIKDIKKRNISKILNALRKNNNTSKKDLSEIINLSPSTLTEICSDLLEQRIIKELGEVNSDKPGRKKVLLSINYDYKKIIGVDIKNNFFSLTLTNLKGDVEAQKYFNRDTSEAYIFINELIDEIKNFITENNLNKKELLGIGISIVGAIDFNTGSTMNFIGFWNESVPLKKIMEDKLEIPIYVNNNVKNLAIYQMFLDDEFSDFFFLKYGTGVGGSLVIQSELFKKESSLSGEIGHSIINNDENICPVCKRKGCFENNYSERAILEKIERRYSKESTPIIYSMTFGNKSNLSFDTILKAAESGEIIVLKILQEAADYLAVLILNMFTLFYPKKIVLCGNIFKNDVFINYLFGYIHNKQIFDFKKIISVSTISEKEERCAPIFSVLKERFYML